jgi:Tfp pilus assembly PilM family ATPase
MARGVGLDAGAFEVKVVELDGSFRKPRLTKVSIDRVAAAPAAMSDEQRAAFEADAALQALKDQKVARQGLNLGFPGREVVLRNLRIPFTGDDAIRKVIKFEAENAIHSHNVDDMVVDFMTYEQTEGESSVLVAAVPKKALSPLLNALEGQGIEPERVDLDAMALFRAAEWAGCFGEDAAEAAAVASEGGDAGEAVAPVETAAEGTRARIVLDVGARATRVLAVISGRLVDVRALRLGVDSVADDVASRAGVGLDVARDAVQEALRTGEAFAVLGAGAAPEAAPAAEEGDAEAGGDDAVVVVSDQSIGADVVSAARDAFLARLRRELMRFLAGLPRVAAVERLYVTGGGAAMPGVVDCLSDVFGCTAQPLDILSRVSHGLDADEAAQVGPRIATAFGLALTMLGGRGGFNFRQEDLAYKRGFDRIKFPLAIACVLAAFLPFLYGLRQLNQLRDLGKRYGELYQVAEGGQARRGASAVRATFWGYVGLLMNDGQPNSVLRPLGPKNFETLTKQLVDAETFKRLPAIRSALEKHLQDQQEQTGVFEDLRLPSGVYVLSYFADAVQRIEKQLGSFLIAELDLNMQPRQPSLQVKIALRGEDFRNRVALLQDALRATFDDPNSPFSGFGLAGGEDVFREGDGATVTMKIDLKEEFETEVQR